jgi:hypothetical protein
MAVNEPVLVAELLAAGVPDASIPSILVALAADFWNSKEVVGYIAQILGTNDAAIVNDLLLHVAEVKSLPLGLLNLVGDLRLPTATVSHIHAVLAPISVAITENENWITKTL